MHTTKTDNFWNNVPLIMTGSLVTIIHLAPKVCGGNN